MSFAQSSDDLEKERLQLEKERRIYDESFQNLQQQINSLTTTITQLQNSGVDDDKLEDIEEQLEELYEDLSKLQETEPSLLEQENSFKEKSSPLQNTLTSEESESTSIPPWFKSNAKWWNEGLISDGDIINALESLIIQDIIPLDKFVKESSGLEHTAGVSPGGTFVNTSDKGKIPSYQKDVFGYWSNGQVSDSEIVDSIGHLMSQGIINSAKIQGEIAERQAKFDQKMKELDSALEFTPDKILDAAKNDRGDDITSTSTANSDGSKTISWSDGITSTFYKDGSMITTFPNSDHYVVGETDPYGRSPGTYQVNTITTTDGIQWHTFSDGSTDVEYPSGYAEKKDLTGLVQLIYGLRIHIPGPDEISKTESPVEGGMQQLTQVTTLVINGIHFPLSQFAMWKWTGECDDAWHYHTPTTQAIAIDGVTGITDPDQENCGFGKVGEVQVATTFMSQEQIQKFRDRTDSDPLTNEAMTGGSDDVASPIDTNPGPVSVEESNDGVKITPKKSQFLTDYDDWDGDGIADEFDDSPYLVSTTFGSFGDGLPGEILDIGGLEVRLIGTEGFGGVIIEITDDGSMFKTYEDGEAPYAIIQIMGVEFEFLPGIYELSFG
ncbi:MAG: hypothetical protein ACW9W4_08230 [Candidatus Nitrosopumilus sp. bin_7KS]